MRLALSYLCLLLFLTGCSAGTATSMTKLSDLGKLGVGQRGEVRLNFEEPYFSGKDPRADRRGVYDQNRDTNAFLDQTICVTYTVGF